MSRRVLIIPTGGLRREGITSSILTMVRHMPLAGLELSVAAVYNNEPDVLDELRSLGCRVIETPDRRADTACYARYLLSLMRRERYDVVHVHGSSSVMGIELRLAQLAGVGTRLAHSHNTRTDDPKRDRMLRPLFRRSWTKALACGEDAGKWLFEGAPFEVVHNGVETGRFAFDPTLRQEMRERLGLGDSLAIGFVGNVNYVKNQRFLLDAFSEVLHRGADARLFIVGDGPDRAAIEAVAAETRFEGRVTITGRVSNVPDIVQAMDVMALPSLFEGLPNVVLEWQASGVPCVVSDAVTRECAVTGLVSFLPLDVGATAWADALLEAVTGGSASEKPRLKSSVSACSALAATGFDADEMARRMREIYLKGVSR